MLLLDEPFGALDAIVRAELRQWLRRLHDEQGVTTVLVTHDQEEAMDVADRIAVMNEGRIEQVGAPREVYDAPATDFVMGFLGPVSKLGDELVRPHDITLRTTPDDTHTVEAMVARVVHLGFEVRIDLELAGGETAFAQLTRDEANALELAAGDIVYVRHAGSTPPATARATGTRPGARDDGHPGAAQPQRVTQASGSSASLSIAAGRWPAATSATVTRSSTLRRLARTAIQTRPSATVEPL